MPESTKSPAEALVAGQWLVWNAAPRGCDPRYEAAEIAKVTARTITCLSAFGRETRRNIDGSEVWSGPEAEAKTLAVRLNSSAALMKDEVRRSRELHSERVSNLVQASIRGGEA